MRDPAWADKAGAPLLRWLLCRSAGPRQASLPLPPFRCRIPRVNRAPRRSLAHDPEKACPRT